MLGLCILQNTIRIPPGKGCRVKWVRYHMDYCSMTVEHRRRTPPQPLPAAAAAHPLQPISTATQEHFSFTEGLGQLKQSETTSMSPVLITGASWAHPGRQPGSQPFFSPPSFLLDPDICRPCPLLGIAAGEHSQALASGHGSNRVVVLFSLQ